MTIDELEDIAKRATPGAWKKYERGGRVFLYPARFSNYPTYALAETKDDPEGPEYDKRLNGEFIATFNPQRVLSLLSALRESEEALEFYADEETWRGPTKEEYENRIRFGIALDCQSEAHIPGERAREALEKMKEMMA